NLDVQPNRLSVGGVRSLEPLLHRRGQVTSHDFVGCIMEFAVNGRPLEPSQALASRGVLDSLSPPPPPKKKKKKKHGGTCIDRWSWQQCQCVDGFTGTHCENLKQGPKRDLLLRQALQGSVTSDPRRQPGSSSSLEVKFRTRSKTGTLLHIQEHSNYTTL
ncbi:hypothetical protein CRUP_036161, partial [Coryphaenoides rupestris]